MKKLLSLLAFAGLLIFISCGDDDEAPSVAPSVTAPAASTTTLSEAVELTFAFTSDAGITSTSSSATGGSFSITSDAAAGSNSGNIIGTFTPSAVGAGSVTVSVTDANGTDDAVAVITINADQTTPIVLVRGNIEEDATWTADNIYQLDTRVTVEDGVTLTIEPGTVIKGNEGQGAASTALLVARGGTLNANGTAALPIIFTSVLDPIDPSDIADGNYASTTSATQAGLWGGVIVLGSAPISASNDDGELTEVQIEGIPASDPNGLYGGNDSADNSGTITYISIRHGGTNIGAGNEINGLTLGGVGSGTTINHVEVVANADDGIEWFGGSVTVDDVIVWNSNDDGLDTDQDWIGACNNFVVVTPIGGSAMELDGPEGTLNAGTHQFDNGVIYAGADIDHIIDWDASTNAGISNTYFFGITTAGDFETFGGDGTGTNTGWETDLASGAAAFAGVPDASVTYGVAVGAKTVGPASSDYDWSWAGNSGALSDLGF